jgi:hypothetical protein
MPAFSEPDQRWRLLVPAGAVVVEADPRHAAVEQIRALPAQTTVALVGGRRLRRLARRARLRVHAEYLALPSLGAPVALTQCQPHALRYTARTVLTVPSGVTRPHLPIWLAVRLIRAVPRLLSRSPAGDRLVLGVRS